jgi:hypothetical protein
MVTIDGVEMPEDVAQEMGLLSTKESAPEQAHKDAPQDDSRESSEDSGVDVISTDEHRHAIDSIALETDSETAGDIGETLADHIIDNAGGIDEDFINELAETNGVTKEQMHQTVGDAYDSQVNAVHNAIGDDGWKFLQGQSAADAHTQRAVNALARQTALGKATKADWTDLVVRTARRFNSRK